MAVRDDDLAATLLELEERLSRREIAARLGVDERRLDEIASGYLPEAEVAERLRALAGSGVEAPGVPARRLSPAMIAAFVVADTLLAVAVAALVLLR